MSNGEKFLYFVGVIGGAAGLMHSVLLGVSLFYWRFLNRKSEKKGGEADEDNNNSADQKA
jgi:hypothetical protein